MSALGWRLCCAPSLGDAAGRFILGESVGDEAFFEARVRPVLAEHCWSCHGTKKQEGGLRLDSRAAVLRGGDGGTVVELADGQSFALAGLLSEKMNEDVAKFPLLGDIPILGALFRSSSFKKNESELVVIVTPHLVKPLDMSRQTLPTDKYGDPGDFRFYLLGDLVGSASERKSSIMLRQTGFDGEVGHIVPK